MLLHDGYTRVMNFTAALGSGSLEIWRGAFTRERRPNPYRGDLESAPEGRVGPACCAGQDDQPVRG